MSSHGLWTLLRSGWVSRTLRRPVCPCTWALRSRGWPLVTRSAKRWRRSRRLRGAERSTLSSRLSSRSAGVFTTTRITVFAFAPDGSGTLTASPTSVAYRIQRQHDHVHVYRGDGGTNSGAVTIVVPTVGARRRRPGRTPGTRRRINGNGVGQRANDHGVRRHAGGERHRHDHLRKQSVERARRDGAGNRWRGDLAGAGEVDQRRDADQSREFAEHHRAVRRTAPGR